LDREKSRFHLSNLKYKPETLELINENAVAPQSYRPTQKESLKNKN
jgi:hypothetical protein